MCARKLDEPLNVAEIGCCLILDGSTQSKPQLTKGHEAERSGRGVSDIEQGQRNLTASMGLSPGVPGLMSISVCFDSISANAPTELFAPKKRRIERCADRRCCPAQALGCPKKPRVAGTFGAICR